MRVPVKNRRDPKSIERFFEPPGSQVRIDGFRFAGHRVLHRRIVQQRDARVRAQPCERRLEFHRLVDRFLHELLHYGLAPRTEGAAAKSAAEAFDTGKADALHLVRVTIEHHDTRVPQNVAHVGRVARLVVVIAKHGDQGHLAVQRDLFGEPTRFIRQTVVGEIAAQQQHVRRERGLFEQALQGTR